MKQRNELVEFIVGLAMLVIGLYLFTGELVFPVVSSVVVSITVPFVFLLVLCLFLLSLVLSWYLLNQSLFYPNWLLA